MNSKKIKVPLTSKIALLVACFFWAASFIASKVALSSVPALTVVSFRLIISAICFLGWLLFSGKRIKIKEPAWWWKLLLLSFFGTGLHYGIQTIGIGYTTASNASVYAATGPVTITIIAALFLGEKITWKKAMGIGCALIGVFIIIGIDNILAFGLKGNVLGDFLVFTSIFMWGIFTVMGKDMTRRMSVLEITTVVTVMGAIYMAPLGIIEMSRFSLDLVSIPLEAWLSIVFLGVTCSFLATLLYFFALDKTESQKVGVYLYTIPPMTVVIAAIYLKENIGLNFFIGVMAVLFGVYLTEKG
ncbi:MAG: DMT family transporter [Candidatus Aminicenantes bacterium]|nr:DMT family transporter [Candidatus Aminicenantes bacterium]